MPWENGTYMGPEAPVDEVALPTDGEPASSHDRIAALGHAGHSSLEWAGIVAGSVAAASLVVNAVSGTLTGYIKTEFDTASALAMMSDQTKIQFFTYRDNEFTVAIQKAIAGKNPVCVDVLKNLQVETKASSLNTPSSLWGGPSSEELVDQFAVDNTCGTESKDTIRNLVTISFSAADLAFEADTLSQHAEDLREEGLLYEGIAAASGKAAGVSSVAILAFLGAQQLRSRIGSRATSHRPKRTVRN